MVQTSEALACNDRLQQRSSCAVPKVANQLVDIMDVAGREEVAMLTATQLLQPDASITVKRKLLADGVDTGKTLDLTANWTASFTPS